MLSHICLQQCTRGKHRCVHARPCVPHWTRYTHTTQAAAAEGAQGCAPSTESTPAATVMAHRTLTLHVSQHQLSPFRATKPGASCPFKASWNGAP